MYLFIIYGKTGKIQREKRCSGVGGEVLGQGLGVGWAVCGSYDPALPLLGALKKPKAVHKCYSYSIHIYPKLKVT